MNTRVRSSIYVESYVINIYATFQLHPLMASEKKIFFSLENLAFLLPWQPIKIGDFDKINVVGRGLLQEHFYKIFVKISAVTQKFPLSNFHFPISTFPHYKSMETLSCHSNETTWATTIKKNIIYVETNVMNMYA